MELLQLKYFHTVAKTENISQAAKHHMIAQPAMSKNISNLELELGVKLFDRNNNSLHLNENGKIFLSYVENILNDLQNAVTAVQDVRQKIMGDIRLLVLEHRRMITECIVEFKKIYPDVSFSICHDLFGSQNFDYDLLISAIPIDDNANQSSPLLNEKFMLALPMDHPLAKQQSISMVDLSEERFIFLPKYNSVHQIVISRCNALGFKPNISIVCDDPYYVRKYVSIGLGIAFVPSLSWKGLYEDNVKLLPIREEGFHRTTSVFWPKNQYMTNAAKQFCDFIQNKFKEANLM